MFSCELKFDTDKLKKWLQEKYFSRHKELDFFTKQQSKKENPIGWEKQNVQFVIFIYQLPPLMSPARKSRHF